MIIAHFVFESGANPYIATTEQAFKQMMRKYRGRVKRLSALTYYVFD